MTAVFEKHGLSFQYPENWELQHEIADEQTVEIQLVAPSGAFWSLLAFPNDEDPEVLMKLILDSLIQQYDSVEYVPAKESFANAEASGYDVHFFCLDLLVTTRLRYIKGTDHHLILMCQAENREFEKMDLVFKAITIGMLGVDAELPELLQFTADH